LLGVERSGSEVVGYGEIMNTNIKLVFPELLEYYLDPNFEKIAEAIMAGFEERE